MFAGRISPDRHFQDGKDIKGYETTCTVTATNSVETSSAFAATGPIIPEEQVSGGLPISLLYQINQ
jgi:hypothetical protein